MDIRISGHQVDTGEALKEHVRQRMTGLADKYFARAISAQVTFGKGPHDHRFRCDIVAHVMANVVLKGSGDGAEAHPAFDVAADRIEKQLRRHMKKLKDRQQTPPPPVDLMDNADYRVFSANEPDEEAPDNPLVIAETRVDIPDASVGDAVMMLDLRNTGALLFKNAGTGIFNMVYRRDDGTIGWVEPH